MAAANPPNGERAARPPISVNDSTKRPRMIVAIPSEPSFYKPGCGPPLQPVCLVPVNDSTGYIIERILLPSPGLAKDGKALPKRMTYIVGWRDLPAASLLVPAMEILDYVSPRALEEWEENLEDEMDDERARLADATVAAEEHARIRPPAHTGIEAAAAVEPGPEAERPKPGAMSLSTPQKRKLADFEGLSDEDSPSAQIAREILYNKTQVTQDADDENAWGQASLRERLMSAASLAQHGYVDPDDIPARKREETTRSLPVSRGSPAKVTPVPLPSIPGFTYATTPETSASTRTSSPAKPAKKQKKLQKPANGADEPLWEVERLEDMAIYEVEGHGLVRYFKVRWVGDWPKDQNPSWEPEDNIPENLVRNYFKRGKRGQKRGTLPGRPSSVS